MDIFPEVWHAIGPLLEGVLRTGKPEVGKDFHIFLDREGYPEETYFLFSYSGVRDDVGGIEGVFCTVFETTEQKVTSRRVKTLHVTSTIPKSQNVDSMCTAFMKNLEDHNNYDVPFALLYIINGQSCTLAGTSGIAPNTAASPNNCDLKNIIWPLQEVITTKQPYTMPNLQEIFNDLPTGAWAVPPHTAVLLPINEAGSEVPRYVLVVGVNPHKKLDEQHNEFFSLLSHQLSASITDALAHEHERQKSEALAEVNRAKTTFFSNISHEFRTPLTLIQGPIEEALNDEENPISTVQRERLLMCQRNTRRLLKLVNSLLDFARVESSQMKAKFQETDLTNYTVEIISMFGSAFERANIELKSDIRKLSSQVYVDRDMWEKIIINLLSNALKYTLKGSVEISLRENNGFAEFIVKDTGVGIPEDALPRVFERFYRVENVNGRSHEGTGIGLALSQSLAKLHGGIITVESTLDKGSTFTVSIPISIDHIPQNQIIEKVGSSPPSTPLVSIDEAVSFLDASNDLLPHEPIAQASKILVVDDNADMRQYIQRMLAQHWSVIVADNGVTALEILKTVKPDVIVTDVMMPHIDGIQLLSIVKNDKSLKEIPVILISARGSEDARVEGINLGASDYLVKPFSTKELVARIQNQIERKRHQEQAIQQMVLQTSYEKLVFQKKLQEEFIDTVCHEIRNPLNGMEPCIDGITHSLAKIQSYLPTNEKMIIGEAVSKISSELLEAKELLETLHVCTEQQRLIVDDVLDLSKLENNKVTLNSETFSPKQVILATLQMFQQQMTEKKLTLNLGLGDNFYIISDSRRFMQLVINLVSNAVKFTLEGSISVTLERRENNDQMEVEVHVKDTGLGIRKQEQEVLFSPFSQANETISPNFGGTGLGLSICKKLVKIMNGTIHVISEKGVGSDFYFILNVSPTTTPVQPIEMAKEDTQNIVPPQNILIVEDNYVNQKVLARHLTQAGHTVKVANNGLEACQIYQANEFRPSLIFMDIEMPVRNGLDATREIRAYEKENLMESVYIIGLSGNARREHIDAALNSGMNSYITKPFHKETLLKNIRQGVFRFAD
jgi:signal transduction histidine kinase